MFGLDDRIASFSDGTTLLVVMVVAILLGLRHASDPDHLAAVTTLIASGKERAARRASMLGLVWGFGHATSLFVFGVPIVLYRAYLPARVQQGAETSVGVVIVVLAVWLLLRWRRGMFDVHMHGDGGPRHAHGPAHPAKPRTRVQAYAIGLIHGLGGTAGVGILLLSSIPGHALAIVALGVFALFTAISMAVVSGGFGLTLSAAPIQRSFARLAPVLATVSLLFGAWYALGAQGLVPYYF
jgi:ABC-type nickel/cobalt efflux system permease component RcnA